MGDATDLRDRMDTKPATEHFLGRLGQRVRDTPVWLVAAGALAIAVAADGLSLTLGFREFLTMAQHPLSDPGISGEVSYILSSPAGTLAAATVGATTPATFAAFHATLVLLAFAAVVWTTRRNHGAAAANTVSLMWAALPISHTLLTWIGRPDPFMFAAGTAFAVTSSPAAVMAWGALGGFTSKFQAALIVVAVAVVSRRPWRWSAAALAGIAVGAGGVSLWHHVAGISQEVNRVSFILNTDPWRFIGGVAGNWQALLWSLFAGAWPVVVWLVWRDRRTVAVLAGAALVLLVTVDQTRVFALLTWPVVYLLALRIDDVRAVGWLTVAAVALPAVAVTGGHL